MTSIFVCLFSVAHFHMILHVMLTYNPSGSHHADV